MKTVIEKLVLACLVVILFAGGCASYESRSHKMIPENFEIANRHDHSVSVIQSTGGRETNPMWTSQISNSAFTEALSNALTKSGVFRSVVKGGKADYMLRVMILDYDKPIIGADFDIKMKTKWELTNPKTNASVWSDTFATTYRAKLTDAFFAAERLQKANEGSVRVNIKEGIKRLSMLEL